MKMLVRVLAPVLLCSFVVNADDLSPQQLIDGGHWKRLRALGESRVKANASDAEAAYLLAYARLNFEDVDGALIEAKRAVALNPNSADYHFLLGRAIGEKAGKVNFLKAVGMASDFKKENSVALAIDPNHIQALLDLVDYYWSAPGIAGGDKKKAAETADRIGKIDPSRGFLAEASLAQREDKPDLAKIEELQRKALEANRKSYLALIALANTLISDNAKKYGEAEQLAREAIKVDPGRPSAYSILAIVYVNQDRWQDLDATLQDAEKNVPDCLAPFFVAGRTLLVKKKDLSRAERYFRKYLTQDPEGGAPHAAYAHWRLGLVLEKEGRKPEAINEIETSTKLEPNFEPARKDLKRLK